MCYVIYFSLIALLLIYSDSVVEQFALSESAGEGQWIMMATGWELVPAIWPLLLMAMVFASALTFFVARAVFRQR
ncbi:MAG: hypothetical protein M3H12_16055 [Chromatiales bacterium]|nr:hypothetical protein [Gammaproteobacteria bacterium]